MATKIEWADEVWNPVTGCSPVSRGCDNCYARRMSKRLAGRHGYCKTDPFRVTFHMKRLDIPLSWRRPRRVFVCSMGDLFHGEITLNLQDNVWKRMAWCYWHTFIILTKRPLQMQQSMRYTLKEFGILHNVWLGISAEDAETLTERWNILETIPAAKHIISYEPALGPIKIPNKADWVIAGAETGPDARAADLDWFRSVRDDCKAADIPLFLKQINAKRDIALDGEIYQEFPEKSAKYRGYWNAALYGEETE